MKRCRRCRIEKNWNQFQKSNQSKDGYSTNCSLCITEFRYEKENRAEREKSATEINAFIMENLKFFDGKIRLGINEHKSMVVNKFRK